MAWEVKWAEIAWADLDAIAAYIARDSPNYASAVVRQLLDAGQSLGQMAERGRVVPEWKEPSIRELIAESYRLIYQVSGKTVHVIGVIHGARDLNALWERESRQPSRN